VRPDRQKGLLDVDVDDREKLSRVVDEVS